VQLDDKVTPLIDTPKVTALQMLICVGAGESPPPPSPAAVVVTRPLVFGYGMWGLVALYFSNLMSHKREAAAARKGKSD
jgi:hypothetical protein